MLMRTILTITRTKIYGQILLIYVSFSRKVACVLLYWLYKLAPRNLSHEQTITALRGLLRRYPFWAAGHRELARISLKGDDVSLAYPAAISLQILSVKNTAQMAEAKLLLGTCFLKKGEWKAALIYFNDARALGLRSDILNEETAAAHILGGEYHEALRLLETIPADKISAEAKAALGYVRSKAG